MIVPKDRLGIILPDVEQFLNSIHTLAATKVDDVWFGHEALRGPEFHFKGTTTLMP
jgi:hypothetical protein